jgi:hypothetical protein
VGRNVSDWPHSANMLQWSSVAMSPFVFGDPQGLSCRPLLYLLYSAQVFDVIADCGLVGHSYADHT